MESKDMTINEKYSFKEARDLIDYFLYDEEFTAKTIHDTNHVGKNEYIFRGQSDASSSWRLSPTVFREQNKLDQYTTSSVKDTNKENREAYLKAHLVDEIKAISNFLENADKMGIATAIDYAATKQALNQILGNMENDSGEQYAAPFPPDTLTRATALAQHYNVPTRLLDWTESPFVACYFAAYDRMFCSRTYESEEIAIYFHSTSDLNKNTPKEIELVRAPKHENLNLRQQQGVFTNIKYANKHYMDNGQWPTLEELGYFKCILLSSSKVKDLLKILYHLGISRHTLMPSLENAAKLMNIPKNYTNE